MTRSLAFLWTVAAALSGCTPTGSTETPATNSAATASTAVAEASVSDAPAAAAPDPELAALVAAIDKDPDPLHGDYTPAVHELADRGFPGALAVIHLLDAPDLWTRYHAQRVVEGVAMRSLGWRPGQGFPGDTHAGDEKAKVLFESNGSYDADGSPAVRRASMKKWQKWLTQQSAK